MTAPSQRGTVIRLGAAQTLAWASSYYLPAMLAIPMARDLGLPALNPTEDRVMICGSPEMLRDLKHMMEARGFNEGNTTKPGDFVIERAFAEQ